MDKSIEDILKELAEKYVKLAKEALLLARPDMTVLHMSSGVTQVDEAFVVRFVTTVVFNKNHESPVDFTNEYSSADPDALKVALEQDVAGAKNRLEEIKLKLEEEQKDE